MRRRDQPEAHVEIDREEKEARPWLGWGLRARARSRAGIRVGARVGVRVEDEVRVRGRGHTAEGEGDEGDELGEGQGVVQEGVQHPEHLVRVRMR